MRSGLFDDERVERDLREAISADLPHLDWDAALNWIEQERADWARDARTWPTLTDYDRLQAVFTRLSDEGLPVLVGCEDHWAASAALRELDANADGLAWFTPMDVWHAVDEPMLEVNIWDREGVNQSEGEPLVAKAIVACVAQGLEAHFDEGRLEIAARWQRLPESPADWRSGP